MFQIRIAALAAAVALLLGGLAWPATAQEIPTEDPPPSAAAAPAGQAQPVGAVWRDVTVETVDDWHLVHSTVQWLSDGLRVRVTRQDGSWRDYDPSQITAITDPDGADLIPQLEAVRPETPAPAGEIGAVGGVVEAPRDFGGGASAPLFGVAIGLGGGVGAFAGDAYSGMGASWAAQLGIRIATSQRSWVHFLYRRQNAGIPDQIIFIYPDTYATVPVDARIDEFFLMFGTRTNPRTRGRTIGYVEFGLGVMNHVASAEFYGSRSSASDAKMGLGLQVGAMAALGEALSLDAGISLRYKPGFFDTYESGGAVFGAQVALVWRSE